MSKKRQRRQQAQLRRKVSSREAAEERAQTRARISTRERREASRRKDERIREQEAASGRRLQYRPTGLIGLSAMLVWGAAIVGAVLWATWRIGRWGYLGYADSLWLYLLIGGVVAAPAVGWVARRDRDITAWTLLVVVAAFAALVYERVRGATCDGPGTCMSFGAQGEWGWLGVGAAMGAGFALTYGVAGFVHGWIADRRPLGSGSTRVRSALLSMTIMAVALGAPLGVTLLGIDAVLRSGPQTAALAEGEVSLECFGFTESVPALAVRPKPEPSFTQRFQYAVAVAASKREKPDGGTYTRAERRSMVTPYEAVVTIEDGRVMTINCRHIHPANEQVTAEQLAFDPAAIGQQTAVEQYYPESEVLQPPLDLVPVPEPPGDPEPPADDSAASG